MNDFLDTIHLPEDAGEHADDLRSILERIPDGWGRWISCDAGWYPLICELHKKILEVAPDYEVHQVKEKFGGVRYYVGFKLAPAFDEPQPPSPSGGTDEEWKEWAQGPMKEWKEREKAFFNTPEGKRLLEEQEKKASYLLDLVREYEDCSYKICEICGEKGEMSHQGYWYKTLCDTHRKHLEYEECKEEDEE